MGLIDVTSLAEVEPKRGWHGRFFHSERMTFAYYTLEAGATLHAHAHANEEVWHVIEGAVDLMVDGEHCTAQAGEAVVIPPYTEHAVIATGGCRVIIVDDPVRHEVAGVRI